MRAGSARTILPLNESFSVFLDLQFSNECRGFYGVFRNDRRGSTHFFLDPLHRRSWQSSPSMSVRNCRWIRGEPVGRLDSRHGRGRGGQDRETPRDRVLPLPSPCSIPVRDSKNDIPRVGRKLSLESPESDSARFSESMPARLFEKCVRAFTAFWLRKDACVRYLVGSFRRNFGGRMCSGSVQGSISPHRASKINRSGVRSDVRLELSQKATPSAASAHWKSASSGTKGNSTAPTMDRSSRRFASSASASGASTQMAS